MYFLCVVFNNFSSILFSLYALAYMLHKITAVVHDSPEILGGLWRVWMSSMLWGFLWGAQDIIIVSPCLPGFKYWNRHSKYRVEAHMDIWKTEIELNMLFSFHSSLKVLKLHAGAHLLEHEK